LALRLQEAICGGTGTVAGESLKRFSAPVPEIQLWRAGFLLRKSLPAALEPTTPRSMSPIPTQPPHVLPSNCVAWAREKSKNKIKNETKTKTKTKTKTVNITETVSVSVLGSIDLGIGLVSEKYNK